MAHTAVMIGLTHDGVDELAHRCRTALAALPDGTVLAGLTAARLHGLWLPPARAGEPIEVILRGVDVVPRAVSGSTRPDVRGRRRQLRRAEVVVRDGLPLTCATRTWVDLAERQSMPDLVAAGDSLLREHASAREVELFVADARGRRGIVRARGAVPLLDARSASRPESHLRFGLVAAGLPAPAVNTAIYDECGQWLAEPDLHFEQARLCLEYNGAVHASVGQMRKDITRALDIARAGWLTLTFGPVQVFQRMPESVQIVRTYLDIRDAGWRRRLRSSA